MTFFLGLTGGIATGKSTAANFFKEKKIPVIDTDQIAHDLMLPGHKSYQALVKVFGNEILAADQTINRKILAQIVFSNSQKLKLLNETTHPLILEEVKKRQLQYQKQNIKLVVIDVPLLFESKWDQLCDASLVITLPYQVQLERLMARNNFDEQEAKKRIASQMPLTEKIKLADYNIDNSASIQDLNNKLSQLLLKIEK